MTSNPTTSATSGVTIMYVSTTDDDDMVVIPTTSESVNATSVSINTAISVSKDISGTIAKLATYIMIKLMSLVAAVPVSVFVGTLVGVVALLVLSTVVIIIVIVLCAYNMNKCKMKQSRAAADEYNVHVYDCISERGREINRVGAPIEMMANEAYGTYGQENATESQATERHYEEIHNRS